jgi:hypothetical protein
MSLDINSGLHEVSAEIQPKKLQEQGFLPPERVCIIEREDSEKEPAYYVYLIYSNMLIPLTPVALSSSWAHGATRLPQNFERVS